MNSPMLNFAPLFNKEDENKTRVNISVSNNWSWSMICTFKSNFLPTVNRENSLYILQKWTHWPLIQVIYIKRERLNWKKNVLKPFFFFFSNNGWSRERLSALRKGVTKLITPLSCRFVVEDSSKENSYIF